MATVNEKVKNLFKDFQNTRNQNGTDAKTIFEKALEACTTTEERLFLYNGTGVNELKKIAFAKAIEKCPTGPAGLKEAEKLKGMNRYNDLSGKASLAVAACR